MWGKEQQLALDGIKNYLANPPVLVIGTILPLQGLADRLTRTSISYPPKRLSPLYSPIGNMTVTKRCRCTDQEISHSKISLDIDRFLSNRLHNPLIIMRTVTIST